MARNSILPKNGQIAFLAVAFLLTASAVAWLGWSAYEGPREASQNGQRNLRLGELSGTITHLDEVLTMSARMAASTGDLEVAGTLPQV